MNPANSYQNILQYLDSFHMPGVWMCGLLFAPPKTAIGKSIMDRLDDWHHRSGDNFDFFCVGYVTWNEFDDDVPVGRLTNREGGRHQQFYFSSKAFHEIRRKVEGESSWRYSGEADLLLVNAVQPKSIAQTGRTYQPRSRLELDEILALDIDMIVRDSVFATPARLMEKICQAADDAAQKGERAEVVHFSDIEFSRSLLRQGLRSLLSVIKLDKPLKSRHFLVGGHLLDSVV